MYSDYYSRLSPNGQQIIDTYNERMSYYQDQLASVRTPASRDEHRSTSPIKPQSLLKQSRFSPSALSREVSPQRSRSPKSRYENSSTSPITPKSILKKPMRSQSPISREMSFRRSRSPKSREMSPRRSPSPSPRHSESPSPRRSRSPSPRRSRSPVFQEMTPQRSQSPVSRDITPSRVPQKESTRYSYRSPLTKSATQQISLKRSVESPIVYRICYPDRTPRSKSRSKYARLKNKDSKYNNKSPYSKHTFLSKLREASNKAYTYDKADTEQKSRPQTSRPQRTQKPKEPTRSQAIEMLRKHALFCAELRKDISEAGWSDFLL